MKKTFNLFFVMMMAVAGVTFTSCSDDDDTPKIPTAEEAAGAYTGKVTYAESSTELELELKNDSVCFAKFPYEPMVIAIVGEDAAKGLIEQIGTLEYDVNYTAAMNAANDSVVITLKPEPLMISVGNLNVEVAIEAANTGTYSVKDKNLKFGLTAKNVKVGENDFQNWTPINLAFDVKKK